MVFQRTSFLRIMDPIFYKVHKTRYLFPPSVQNCLNNIRMFCLLKFDRLQLWKSFLKNKIQNKFRFTEQLKRQFRILYIPFYPVFSNVNTFITLPSISKNTKTNICTWLLTKCQALSDFTSSSTFPLLSSCLRAQPRIHCFQRLVSLGCARVRMCVCVWLSHV